MLEDATLLVGGSEGPRYETLDAGVFFQVYALELTSGLLMLASLAIA